MRKLLMMSVCLWLCMATGLAQKVEYRDGVIAIEGSNVPWLLKTDGSQYAWVTDKYQWGKTYLTVCGLNNKQEIINDSDIVVRTDRRQDGDDLVETYTFTNVSKRKVALKDVGIYTPFNDNYPEARVCMEARQNVHIWPGGRAAYVNAMQMSGQGPHLGLMVTEGEITDYDVWERGGNKGMSNFRGVFALCPPDMTLKPGQSYRLSWRLFAHNGHDFDEQLLRRGGMIVRSEKYVYAVGETARVDFITNKGTKTVSRKITSTGEQRIAYKGTHALLLGISGERELLEKRLQFILDHQQYNNPADPRDGAFMIYDCEGDSILTDDHGRSDLDEGRERIGMGILLAAYALNEELRMKNEEFPTGVSKGLGEGMAAANSSSFILHSSLKKYAKFLREKLQYPDYRTKSNARHGGKNRGYNYAWVADFYFRMSLLEAAKSGAAADSCVPSVASDQRSSASLFTLHSSLQKQYALDGIGTLRSLYRQFGYGFYCIDYPVTTGLKALELAGLDFERQQLLQDFCTTADVLVNNGLNFPKFEVNYEQSIIAPAVQFLCEVYQATGNKRYLTAAQNMLPALESLQWHQPSYRMNEIAIRHWDGYWFGKRQTYGDVYPHYWSAITAAAYHRYAQCIANSDPEAAADYQRRAEQCVRGNLCLFFEDGRATCAFVMPRRVNGEQAHYADAYANDQDWALMYYLMVTAQD